MAKKKEIKKLNPKGKTMKELTKEATKNKKTSEPKSNVRVRSKLESKITSKDAANRRSNLMTEGAKSGTTAYQKAEEIKYQNQKARNSAVSRIKTIKIRGGGAGGMFNAKNR